MAQNGNRQAVIHGVYAFLATGSLPKRCTHVRRLIGRFRTQLETEVRASHGTITMRKAALITSSIQHEGRRQLLNRWLKLEAESLSLPERAEVLRQASSASADRDACIERLGLDASTAGKDLDELYGAAGGRDTRPMEQPDTIPAEQSAALEAM